MNFKRSISIVLILVLSLLLTACGQKPEATVEDYIVSMQAFDLEKMQELTLDHDSNHEIEDELKELSQDILFNFFKENAELIEYEILESEIDDEKGTVKVWFKFVDATSLMGEVLAQYLEETMMLAFAGREIDDDQAEEMLKDTFEQTSESWELVFVEREVDIPVEKKDNNWYISEVSEKLLDVAFSNSITAFMDFTDEIDDMN